MNLWINAIRKVFALQPGDQVFCSQLCHLIACGSTRAGYVRSDDAVVQLE